MLNDLNIHEDIIIITTLNIFETHENKRKIYLTENSH